MSAAQEGMAGQHVGQAAGGEGEEGEELGLLMVWSESALFKLVGQLVESWLTVGDVIKDDSDAEKARERGTQFSCFTCFTGTKVHILTQQALAIEGPATCQLFLLYWYKSARTDAAGACYRGPSARDLPAAGAVG